MQEGLLTIIIAVGAYWFISNYPDTVSWLSKEERSFIQARLRADSDSTHDEQFRWADVLVACKDIKVWLYGLGFHTMSLPLYTLSLFLVSDDLSKSAFSSLMTYSQQSFATWATLRRSLNSSPFLHMLWQHSSPSSGLSFLSAMRSAHSSSSSLRLWPSSDTSSFWRTKTPKHDQASHMSGRSSPRLASTLPWLLYCAGPRSMSPVKRSVRLRMQCRFLSVISVRCLEHSCTGRSRHHDTS